MKRKFCVRKTVLYFIIALTALTSFLEAAPPKARSAGRKAVRPHARMKHVRIVSWARARQISMRRQALARRNAARAHAARQAAIRKNANQKGHAAPGVRRQAVRKAAPKQQVVRRNQPPARRPVPPRGQAASPFNRQ